MQIIKFKTFKQYKIQWILPHPKVKRLNFNQIDNRKYYVYRVTNLTTGLHYYGCRRSKSLDLGIRYFTSSKLIKFDFKKNPQNYKYKILKIFDNYADMLCYETFLHLYFNAKDHPKFYNQVNSNPFGNFGKLDEQSIQKRRKTLTTPLDESGTTLQHIITEKVKKSKQKVGEDGLTNSQKAGLKHSKRMKEKSKEEWENILQKRKQTGYSRDYNGLNSFRLCVKNGNETKRNTIHENGLNTLQNQILKATVTKNNKSPEEKQRIIEKQKHTYKTKVLENGLTVKENQLINSRKSRLDKGSWHHIQIYNDKDELIYDVKGNLQKFCEVNNLPVDAIRKSYKRQTKIQWPYTDETMNKRGLQKYIKFRNWKAVKVN